jgi:hypothetical protein
MLTASYDDFTEAFLGKITEYTFSAMTDGNKQDTVDGYMKRAAAKFNETNSVGFSSYDDTARTFSLDLEASNYDIVVDIVSDGMLVEWLKPYIFRQENLEHLMNTSDFKTYSPAEFLYRLRESYESCKKSFLQSIREYSYTHGDLTDLNL